MTGTNILSLELGREPGLDLDLELGPAPSDAPAASCSMPSCAGSRSPASTRTSSLSSGLVVNIVAAFLFGYANGDNQARLFRYAGLVIIGSGFFDLVDGAVARASNRVTRFGGFFDSVVDRYSDASQFLGLLVFYARGDRFFYVVLTAIVMISAIMVSYTRARAESLIGSCRVGFMERPERLVLVIIGALFNRMAPVLWIIAVLSTITVIHRIRYTWTRTELVDRAASQVPAKPPSPLAGATAATPYSVIPSKARASGGRSCGVEGRLASAGTRQAADSEFSARRIIRLRHSPPAMSPDAAPVQT